MWCKQSANNNRTRHNSVLFSLRFYMTITIAFAICDLASSPAIPSQLLFRIKMSKTKSSPFYDVACIIPVLALFCSLRRDFYGKLRHCYGSKYFISSRFAWMKNMIIRVYAHCSVWQNQTYYIIHIVLFHTRWHISVAGWCTPTRMQYFMWQRSSKQSNTPHNTEHIVLGQQTPMCKWHKTNSE